MSNCLKHYGVRGMKWIIRQTPAPDTLYTKRPDPNPLYTKRPDPNQLYTKRPDPNPLYKYVGDKTKDTSTVISKIGSAKFYRLKSDNVNKGQLYTKSDLFKKKIFKKI